MTKSKSFRKLLETNESILVPGIYDALSAKIAQQVGFDAVFHTGYGTAATLLGVPDIGLVSFSEMKERVSNICNSIDIPVIADADTGYGNIINVQRTVREYERAGVAGFHIEDQVFPKKCGFMEGKAVIPMEEHVQKVKAALDARTNPDTVIIARTDALAPNGWEDALTRARAYREAGADLIFVDGIRTTEELGIYSKELALKGSPCLYNGGLVTAEDAQRMGFKIQILAGLSLAAVFKSATAAMQELNASGTTRQTVAQFGPPGEGETVNDILGVPEVYELEQRYDIKGETVR